MNQCGFFLPVKNSPNQFKHVTLSDERIFNSLQSTRANGKKPFLSILNDEDRTVKLFLDALAKNEFENAKSYISKNYVTSFDLYELSDFFCNTDYYKYMIKVAFSQAPKNCKTNSLLIMNKKTEQNSIVHLHLIEEPNVYGKWKIYGIDKE